MPTALPQTTETSGILPDGTSEVTNGDSLAATVDAEENVLELIFSNADGIYVRENREWSLVDADQDQPTIDDQEWYDVTPDFVTAFDDMIESEDSISRDVLVKYAAAQD